MALQLEARGRRTSLFRVLAEEWRHLLFPDSSDDAFADQYAQTVTFALLLARAEGILFDGQDITVIAKNLYKKHLLMGRALAVLTDESLGGLGVSTDTLLRVIGVVDWDKIGGGSEEIYLRLYEDFLAVYDAKLRQRTGSYYTPNDLVSFMVRSTDDLLCSRLDIPQGFASPEVVVVDPAMGTGTFLLHILQQVADTVAVDEGDEAVGPWLRDMAKRRLIGFEKQMGPFAVAELRLYEALRRKHSDAPAKGLRLYVADTLDSPYVEQTKLGIQYQDIAASRESANKVKRDEPVMVVIGNPPHDKARKGSGKWIETGEGGPSAKAPLDAFRAPGNGRYEYVLANLHVYFWRWGTWKVFDHHRDARCGVVAFVSPSAFLTSPGFAGMRAYLRRTADEGWIVDLSPEGHTPDTATRVFPEVRQPLCIAIFARHKDPQEGSPARIHYLAVSGRAEDKRARLRQLTLDDQDWSVCLEEWQAPLIPQRDVAWLGSPLVSELLPWSSRGVTPGRTWVYAPDEETLKERWDQFLAADPGERREWFGESCDRTLDSRVGPLPSIAPHQGTLAEEAGPHLRPVPIGYRSFDRQWLIPDNRLMVRPRPDLWRVRGDQQVYTCEHPQPPTSGPALTFSAHIPDLDYYKGNGGGRIYPLYRDAEASTPNLHPNLLPYLTQRLGESVTAEDVLAYIACVVAHPTYTARFREELHAPGVRVPLTADSTLWSKGVTLGREVLWLHTYGERYVDAAADRPPGSPKPPEDCRPKVVSEIPDTEDDLPNDILHDPEALTLHIGKGRIAPVPVEVWNYEVSGTKVILKWFGYRKRKPAGKRSSRLDDINPSWWPHQRTTDLLNLLNVLSSLVALEEEQARLLEQILASPQITVVDLESAGVLPVPEGLRKLPKTYGEETLFDN
jgi:predicted helicase